MVEGEQERIPGYLWPGIYVGQERGWCREVQGRRWCPEKKAQWLGWDGAAHKGMLGSEDAEWEGPSGLPQKGSPGQGGASQGWSESFKSAGACWSGEESGSTYPQGRKNFLEMCLNCPSPGPTPTESDSGPCRALKWPQHHRGQDGRFLSNVRYTNCLGSNLALPPQDGQGLALIWMEPRPVGGARAVGGGVQRLQRLLVVLWGSSPQGTTPPTANPKVREQGEGR